MFFYKDIFPKQHSFPLPIEARKVTGVFQRTGYRTTELLKLEQAFEGHLIQFHLLQTGPSDIQLPRTLSRARFLEISKDGCSTTSLGNFCQYSVTLTEKKVFCDVQEKPPVF